MITTNEKKPLFADLGVMARAIENAIRDASAKGMKAKGVHINPKMLEVLDAMKGERIVMIGDYPVVPDAGVPMDRFRLRV